MELIHTPSHHRLIEDEEGRLLLEVECGSTAVFLVMIELNEEERRRFEKEGASYILELSFQVQDNPDEYRKRRNA